MRAKLNYKTKQTKGPVPPRGNGPREYTAKPDKGWKHQMRPLSPVAKSAQST